MSYQIEIAKKEIVIGLGTKGVRRDMAATATLDLSSLPENVLTHIVTWGAERLLQQASQSAERAQVAEWQEKHPKKSPPPAASFPWDIPRLERDALAAIEKRIEEWKAGEIGRLSVFMSALDRRVHQIAELRVRTMLTNARRVADAETVAKGVELMLSHEKHGPEIRAEAERQMEAERKAAQGPVDDDILAMLG